MMPEGLSPSFLFLNFNPPNNRHQTTSKQANIQTPKKKKKKKKNETNKHNRVLIGLTQKTDNRHICRATLEAVCFQTKEVLEAMNKDSGTKVACFLPSPIFLLKVFKFPSSTKRFTCSRSMEE
jgi:hypothetical protein